MTRRRAGRTALLIALAAPALSACARGPSDSAADVPALSRRFGSEGPTVLMTLDRVEATPADRITLRIERAAPPGWASSAAEQDPQPGARLGDFTVAEVRRLAPTMDARGWRLDGAEYVLLPFLPGEESIPETLWRFAPLPGSGEGGEPVLVRTEPLAVTVRSLLDAEDASLAEARGVVDAPPAPRWPWVAGGVGAAAALGALAAAGVAAARRRAREGAAPPAAHEEALAALRALSSLSLAERGEFDAYFTELSRILRRYIERRFDLHAPTLTTDEFLQRARASSAIRAEFVRDLERFLRLADMVKFARHSPPMEEAGRAHDTARAFVEATIPVEAPPTAPGGPVR